MTIRNAKIIDFDFVYKSICTLEDIIFDAEKFQNIFEKNLQNENILYCIAEDNGMKIGFGSVYIQPLLHHCQNIAEVQELFIEENFRGQKVGAKILKELEKFALSKNSEGIELSSNKSRKSAHRFYLREGYINSHEKFVKVFVGF